LAALASSFKNAGGVERALDTVFYLTSSENGFDSISHYLRAALVVNLCSSYFATPSPGCYSFFDKSQSNVKSAPAAKSTAPAPATETQTAQPQNQGAVSPLVAKAVQQGGPKTETNSTAQLLNYLLGDGGTR